MFNVKEKASTLPALELDESCAGTVPDLLGKEGKGKELGKEGKGIPPVAAASDAASLAFAARPKTKPPMR
ncbi:MAG: hypothetical protein KF889_22390 [Alphaproteobacteria bacterium]|nr:hypothetical protein [Alphaproteobacteria bacterium]MCW5743500.1 hypothetical protein [Alphaproteobacteria bacterium]